MILGLLIKGNGRLESDLFYSYKDSCKSSEKQPLSILYFIPLLSVKLSGDPLQR